MRWRQALNFIELSTEREINLLTVLFTLVAAVFKACLGLLALALGSVLLFLIFTAFLWVLSLLWMARSALIEPLEKHRYRKWYRILDLILLILVFLCSFGVVFYFFGDCFLSLCLYVDKIKG